ncbi:MAG TPA: 4a-hydroxytetrahydrobiopterin dehydratase [Ignavibacteria bacterium]
MKALSTKEVNELLPVKLKNWSFDGTYLSRNYKFSNFISAFSFMTAVAIVAEKMDHHPDWNNVYNRVTIKLNSHDAKGITGLDFELGESIEKIFDSHK